MTEKPSGPEAIAPLTGQVAVVTGAARGPSANQSFRVWGEKFGAEGPVRSLGIFQSDDEVSSRWRLALDDPDVLANIDAVFVTVEPGRTVIAKPTGKRILFARLVADSASQ